MNSFSTEKQLVIDRLGKPDRSRKGDVDTAAIPIIETINSKNGYYTTSSCAGRINCFKEPTNGKKHEAEWLYVTHDVANENLMFESLIKLPKETIWLRMEPPIFHVACIDTEAANTLLKLCQAGGWKRSGIISTGGRRKKQDRVMVEIVGNERVDAPVTIDGKLVFDKKYLSFLVKKANEKLEITRKRLDDLRVIFEKRLS